MRVVVDMKYVASEELGNLVRLGIVREVHFTYAVQLLVVQHITILPFKHVKLTLDDVCDSRARVVCWDGHAYGKLSDGSR